jgi:hypothetical protein
MENKLGELSFHSISVKESGTQELADALNAKFKKPETFKNKREETIKSRLDAFQR